MSIRYNIISKTLFIFAILWGTTVMKSYKKTQCSNGTVVCAEGSPTATIPLDQLYAIPSSSKSCLSPAVLCAWQCDQDLNCTNFNYKYYSGTCEMFHYTPTDCSITSGCHHVQVGHIKLYERIIKSNLLELP